MLQGTNTKTLLVQQDERCRQLLQGTNSKTLLSDRVRGASSCYREQTPTPYREVQVVVTGTNTKTLLVWQDERCSKVVQKTNIKTRPVRMGCR